MVSSSRFKGGWLFTLQVITQSEHRSEFVWTFPFATFILSSFMLIHPNTDIFFNVVLLSAFMQQGEEEVYFGNVNGLPKCKMGRLQLNLFLEAQPSNRNCV